MSEVKKEGLEVVDVRAIVTDAFISMIEAALGMKAPDCAPPAFIQSAIDRAIDRINSEALAGYAVLRAEIERLKGNYQDCYANKEAFANNAISLQATNTKLRAELAAIRAQEPVGYACGNGLDGMSNGRIGAEIVGISKRPGHYQNVPLYAAPVAKQVVMPERRPEVSGTWGDMGDAYSAGVNDTLDEVSRLNAADHAEGGV